MGPSHAGHDRKNGVEVFDVEGDFCAGFDLIEVEMTPRKEGSLFVLEHHAVAVCTADDRACFVDGTSAVFEEGAKLLLSRFVSGKPRLKALFGGWGQVADRLLERGGLDLEKGVRGATTRETTFSASDLRAVESLLASAKFCDLGEPCAVFGLEVVWQGGCPFCRREELRCGRKSPCSRYFKRQSGCVETLVLSSSTRGQGSRDPLRGVGFQPHKTSPTAPSSPTRKKRREV